MDAMHICCHADRAPPPGPPKLEAPPLTEHADGACDSSSVPLLGTLSNANMACLDAPLLGLILGYASTSSQPWAVCREWRDLMAVPSIFASALACSLGPDRALARAAGAGKQRVVAALLQLPGGPRADGDDCYALVCAASGGHVTVVQQLLGWGTHPARADCRGGAALLVAACGGHAAVCEALLTTAQHPARPNFSPLFGAAQKGHAGVVRVLLRHMPEVSWGPVVAAAGEGHACIMGLLQLLGLPTEFVHQE